MTLILGGSGQLGTALRALMPEAVAPERDEFDLAVVGQIAQKVRAIGPKTIINCAAYTAVDAAEDDEETATLINGYAVGELAAVADELGVPFVTFSTDYVFDGETDNPYTETSEPNPINAYGRSKLIGEKAALRFPRSLVIRTSWLFSATHPNFVTTILAKAAQGEVQVVDDQWGTPTPVPVLAEKVVDALGEGKSGLLHVVGSPVTSWFNLAREVCRLAGIDVGRVAALSTQQSHRRARRPRFSALSSASSPVMPSWFRGLEMVVDELRPGTEPGDGHSAVLPG